MTRRGRSPLAGHDDLDVRVIRHPVNLGLGHALHTGLRSALFAAADDDVVVVMDADDTHDVNVISAFTPHLERGADIVIASRFVAGGDDSTAPPHRRLLSLGAAVAFHAVLPVKGIEDFTSRFRAYRVSLLGRAVSHWGERLVEEQGFAVMVELLLKLRHCAPTIAEAPLVLRYDRKSSASKLRIVGTMHQYLRLALRDRLQPAPFRSL